jgi:hypothetical protein
MKGTSFQSHGVLVYYLEGTARYYSKASRWVG